MFVQFLHSPTEHKLDSPNHKNWNYDDHYRKFVRAMGIYVKDYKLNTKQFPDELMLWCEWESQSNAKQINKLSKDYPQNLHEPYLDLSAPLTKWNGKSMTNRQNTDPYIFGDNFHYFVCRQGKNNRYTKLSNLQPGDVILFGSNRRETDPVTKIKRLWFVLDTVFVVSGNPLPIVYTPDNFVHMIKPNVSYEYYNISFISAFSSNLSSQNKIHTTKGYKLYFGATYSNPYKGMFSFVPSLPIEHNTTIGFERPTITKPNIISNGLNTNFKVSAENNFVQTKLLWKDTAKQVLQQGLFLGVHFDAPINKTPKSYKLENEETTQSISDCT